MSRRQYKLSQNVQKCRNSGDYIWNHHEKYIEISTNMPGIGSVLCVKFLEFCETKRSCMDGGETNGLVQCDNYGMIPILEIDHNNKSCSCKQLTSPTNKQMISYILTVDRESSPSVPMLRQAFTLSVWRSRDTVRVHSPTR